MVDLRGMALFQCCDFDVNGSTSVAGGLPGLQNRWGG